MLSRDVSAADTCEQLRALSLPDRATVTDTRTVAANAAPFFAPRPSVVCSVKIAPTTDSDIKVEVWLPIGGWNGKFQAVGNGDAAGVISYDGMIEADPPRLCDELDRHRPRRQHHGVRARPPRQVRRLRLSRRSRDDDQRESDRRGLLRHRARRTRTGTAARRAGGKGITEAIRYPRISTRSSPARRRSRYMQLHAVRLALNRFVPSLGRQLHSAARNIR